MPLPNKLPSCLDFDAVVEACVEDNNTGFCIECGEVHDMVEPDAREYECEVCGENAVYGASELVIHYGTC